MPGAYGLIQQTDFSRGMWRAGDPEAMPPNSFFDGENTLLDRSGAPFARGGCGYDDSESFDVAGIVFVWDGVLANGHTTIVASPHEYGKLTAGTYARFGTGLMGPGRAASYNGVLYFPGGSTYNGTTLSTASLARPYYTVAANRLIAAGGHRVNFSGIDKPGTFNEAIDYHEIPGGAEILGVEGMRDGCMVFTTKGIWVISGLAAELVDAEGNVQHRLDHYSGDLVLWGDAGVAAWQGSLVVPGTDAVWLVRRGVTSEVPDAFTRLSDPIVELYQSYVKAGYHPGQAAVHRNHYLLPIYSSGRIVDMLVARLDLPDRNGNVPWTRFSGEGAEVAALAVRSAPGAQAVLIGGEYAPQRGNAVGWGESEWGGGTWMTSQSGRLLGLSYFDPSVDNTTDAQGNPPRWSLETRSIPTGGLTANLCSGARLRYALSGPLAPQISAEFASDTRPRGVTSWGESAWGEGTWETPETTSYEPLRDPAPESADAALAHRWHFARKRRFVRLRLTCNEPTSQLQLRSLELFVRRDARI